MPHNVTVVIGTGGMGLAIARRIGSGKTLLVADFDHQALKQAAQHLENEGHSVHTRTVDVSIPESVAALAEAAAELGSVTAVVHTAGVSPAQAPVEEILRVDLLGTALVLDEFARHIAPGGAGIIVASMAGHMATLPPEHEHALAHTPAADLLALDFLNPDRIQHPAMAYAIAKRANTLRVRAAATPWGTAAARINSLSPGVISTAMSRQELTSDAGDAMRAMVDNSAAGRLGTPDDIAAAAAFLLGPDAAYITGTDLLIDGGVLAALR